MKGYASVESKSESLVGVFYQFGAKKEIYK